MGLLGAATPAPRQGHLLPTPNTASCSPLHSSCIHRWCSPDSQGVRPPPPGSALALSLGRSSGRLCAQGPCVGKLQQHKSWGGCWEYRFHSPASLGDRTLTGKLKTCIFVSSRASHRDGLVLWPGGRVLPRSQPAGQFGRWETEFPTPTSYSCKGKFELNSTPFKVA